MKGLIFASALAWQFVPLLPPDAAGQIREDVGAARGVLAIERAMAYRLPANPTAADPTAADRATLAAHRAAALGAGTLTRLNPWAMRRVGVEIQRAGGDRTALSAGQRAAAGERADFLTQLHSEIAAPK